MASKTIKNAYRKYRSRNTTNKLLRMHKKGKLKDIARASDQLNLQSLTKPVIKHIICYPK